MMTETDLRSWYHRMATTLVSAAAQANEIKRQGEAIGELKERLDRMVEENNKLRSDVAEAMEFVRQAEIERDKFKASLDTANEMIQRQADTIKARDEQIDELRLELSVEREGDAVTRGERDQAVTNYNREKGDKEYWRDRAGTAETRVAETQSRVSELEKALASALRDRDEAMATVVKVKAAVGALTEASPDVPETDPLPEGVSSIGAPWPKF
jgi:chromosome segregation ATPase